LVIEMEPTEEEQRQARRVQLLLYGMMAVMIGVPVLIFIFRHL
jgi:predicted nucleic acid-binding Zn ribbon protein